MQLDNSHHLSSTVFVEALYANNLPTRSLQRSASFSFCQKEGKI